MAHFKSIVITQKTDNLINRSVVIQARRYLPKHKRWSVSLKTGWPMDDIRNPKIHFHLSKAQVRAHLQEWLHS